jgi:uncharacterized Zn finger protein
MSSLPILSKKEILEWVDDERIFDRGLDYFQSGSIFNTRRQGSTLRASCRGSERKPYQLVVRFDKRGIKDAECSCPYDFECKHLVALLFQ